METAWLYCDLEHRLLMAKNSAHSGSETAPKLIGLGTAELAERFPRTKFYGTKNRK